MTGTDELRQLLKQKRELEQRIKYLTTGSLIHNDVKIDRIGFAGKYQQGKWALFYKYKYIVNCGREGRPQDRTKWTAIINAETMEGVLNQIPGAIKALQDLYEEAVNHGTDT